MTRPSLRIACLTVALALVAAACTSSSNEVVLLTHDSFALSEETLASFTEETGITIVVRFAGDVGTMINQAILTKDNPIADVMFGIDNTFLSRAIDNDIFAPYEAREISAVPSLMRVQGDLATPIDFGDVCVNYDIGALSEAGISPPQDLSDLVDPTYRDLLVVQDPALSSPGLAFLLESGRAHV